MTDTKLSELLDDLLYEYSAYQSRVSERRKDRDNPPQNLHPERFEKIRASIEAHVGKLEARYVEAAARVKDLLTARWELTVLDRRGVRSGVAEEESSAAPVTQEGSQ